MSAAKDPSAVPGGKQAATPTPPSTAGSTALQSAPPDAGAESSIPLTPLTAPAPEASSPEELAREIGRLDWVLNCLVLVLAFLIASTTIRNTDIWQHLASGRLYAHGHFQFGTDPFTYTSENTYWVNHSWLFDLGLYLFSSLFGGPDSALGGAAVVVLKAVLVTLVAFVLLRTGRTNQSIWIPAVFTTLALVAMASRLLLLQPILLSLLCLSVTLYLLQSPKGKEPDARKQAAPARSPFQVYWLLVPLFALWANLDNWFLLGPATVELFLLGQLLQRSLAPIRTGEEASDPAQLRTLALVLVAGLAACLLNPHHYHVFQLPFQVSPSTPLDILSQDIVLWRLFWSPFSELILRSLDVDLAYLCLLTYYVLLATSLVSFGFVLGRAWRWWRVTVWLPFAILGALNLRDVPLFAVIAAPIAALNFQDFVAGRYGVLPRVEPRWRAWSLGGRLASIVGCLGLLILAWPGWLHARFADTALRNRVSWAMEVDPALRGSAEQLNTWRQQGLLSADEQGFNYSPDVLNYCAWFCADEQGRPREKGFYDYRIELFTPEIAKQYVDVRHFIQAPDRPTSDTKGRPTNWQELFRKRHIGHVVLMGNSDLETRLIWQPLLMDWNQWQLVYQNGRSMIFRWQDPRQHEPSAAPHPPRFDPEPLAFGPEAQRIADTGPGREPQVTDLYGRFLRAAALPALEGQLAERYLEYYRLIGTHWLQHYLVASQIAHASVLTNVPVTNPPMVPSICCNLVLPLEAARTADPRLRFIFMAGQDAGPVSATLLAVRAARVAISKNPDDAQGYLALGKAYYHLQRCEDHWTGSGANLFTGTPRANQRKVQILAALEHGLKLQQTDPDAHEILVELYRQSGFFDLTLEHLRFATLFAMPRLGENLDQFETRRRQMATAGSELEKAVEQLRKKYQEEAADQPLVNKVQIALGHQLGKQALDLLLTADADEISLPAANFQLSLLLATGRTDELRQRLDDPESRDILKRLPSYDDYVLYLKGADGDYAQAEANLAERLVHMEKAPVELALGSMQQQIFARQQVGMLQGTLAAMLQGLQPGMLQGLNTAVELVRHKADFRVLRGLLALELGDTEAAARQFREALNVGDGHTWEFEARSVAYHYLQHLEAAQKQATKK
jgi:tetratricopeptide (TPR) repeat protein